MFQRKILVCLLLMLTGCVTVLAFSPFNYFYLPYFTLAILLMTLQRCSPLQAAFRQYCFGIGYFGAGISWVFVSIHRFGDIAWPFASLLTFALVLVLSFFFFIQAYLLNRFYPHAGFKRTLLAFPALWILSEWLRGWVFTGFPWLFLGESQTLGPLTGFLPLVGVFGTSWLVALSASLLFNALICLQKKRLYQSITLVFSLIILFIFGQIAGHINWSKPASSSISVALVQGNIPQSMKWDPNLVNFNLNEYNRLTKKTWGNTLIIWPENAVPLPLDDAQPFLADLDQQAKDHHASILLGIPVPANADNYYNALIAVGETRGNYFKKHLVPFGEYIPFERYFHHLFELMRVPMSDFVAGDKKQPLIQMGTTLISPLICYEVAYPSIVRSTLPEAQLFVVISNDAWFGDSIAAWQHLQITQAQAIASHRPFLFSTNNGVSAIINQQGKLTAIAPRFTPYVLTGQITPQQGSTLWVFLGDLPILLFAILLLFIILI